jgi:hypothetical protein
MPSSSSTATTGRAARSKFVRIVMLVPEWASEVVVVSEVVEALAAALEAAVASEAVEALAVVSEVAVASVVVVVVVDPEDMALHHLLTSRLQDPRTPSQISQPLAERRDPSSTCAT